MHEYGQPSRQDSANLAIFGKSTKPPKEIDDPVAEPAPNLALKRVRNDLSLGKLQIAREDFQRELGILLELTNPPISSGICGQTPPTDYPHHNIVELFGIGFDDANGDAENPERYNSRAFNQDLQPSFLILGLIRSTLSKRLVRWRDEKGIGLFEGLLSDIFNRRNHWIERVLLISNIAHAIEHLHNHQILYRDLKPDNIGFDALDVPKLFDFGLAKKLSDDMRFRNRDKSSEEESLDDGLYYLTAETGTVRYMAIEVGKGRPYGWSADVYSLAILMHEVLSLTVPFAGISPREFRQVIWNQGRGLVIDPLWPDPMQDLLPQMWHSDPTKRPTIGQVVELLDGMLRGSELNLFPRNMLSRSRRFTLFRMP